MQKVTELLVEACQLADLVLISGALDAFYDIFSEDYYNQALVDCGVLEHMEKGQASMQDQQNMLMREIG